MGEIGSWHRVHPSLHDDYEHMGRNEDADFEAFCLASNR